MRVIAALGVLLGIALVIGAVGARRALACSAGPDFDPIQDSDIIVEGRLVGYEVLSETPPESIYLPVRVDIDIQRVYKGSVTTEVLGIFDYGSLIADSSGYVWSGAGGSCGAFDSEPTGRYGIMGLIKRKDGTYASNRLLWFFFGDGPNGEAYQRALTRLSLLPGAGFGPGNDDSGIGFLVPAAGLAATGALLLLAGAAWSRRTRHG